MSQENKKQVVKSTNAIMQERIDEITLQLLTGSTRAQIQQNAAEKYGLTERPIDELIARATAQIKEINAPKLMDSVEQVMGNLWFLYKQALKAGDRRLALDTLKEVAKIKGLNELTLIHKFDKEEYRDVSNDELERIASSED